MIKHISYIFLFLLSTLTTPNFIQNKSVPVEPYHAIISKDDMVLTFIKKRCKETRIPERLIYNVIKVESKWKYPTNNVIVGDSMVQSNHGAYGLMQVQLPTAWEMMNDTTITEEMLMKNDTLNIDVGIRYLVWLHRYYHGNFYFAITAYNRGISNVDADIDSLYNPMTVYTLATTKGVFFGKIVMQKMRDEMLTLHEKTNDVNN